MSFSAGAVYASETNEGHNIQVVETTDKNGKVIEYLESVDDDGYLRITQIVQNSQNVKINTSTFEGSLLISGKVNKNTNLTIKVFHDTDVEQPSVTYDVTVGTTEAFSQPIEIGEGESTIIVNYMNKKDNKEDYVTFYVSRGTVEKMIEIKSYLAIPSIK